MTIWCIRKIEKNEKTTSKKVWKLSENEETRPIKKKVKIMNIKFMYKIWLLMDFFKSFELMLRIPVLKALHAEVAFPIVSFSDSL